jgi:hypothetical protein
MWWWRYISEWLGIGVSGVYAVATYGFFHFLDRKASGAAKRAVSKLIQAEVYARIDLGEYFIGIFDRLQVAPRLHLGAFLRSCTISCISFVLAQTYFLLLHINQKSFQVLFDGIINFPEFRAWYAWTIATAIVGDYVSLFLIRRIILLSKQRLLYAAIFGSITGLITVLLIFRRAPSFFILSGRSYLLITL